MKQTILSRVTLCFDGSAEIRLMKQVFNDGELIWEEPHRFAVQPFEDVDDQLPHVKKHLESMGYPLNDKVRPAVKRLMKTHRDDPDVAVWVKEYGIRRALQVEKEEQERQRLEAERLAAEKEARLTATPVPDILSMIDEAVAKRLEK